VTTFEALETGASEAIRDPLWGHVYMAPELAEVMAGPAFQKLRRILQLGPASAVYPGATHTRAAHSLGVYHLARRLLRHLLERGASAWTTPVGVRSFLAAALLHDIGHFPYAHSLKELPLADHENLTGVLIAGPALRGAVAASGADPEMAAAVVDHGRPADAEVAFYRRLLSGVLDPDKLDYLNRDARYCGVPYGAQDVDFTYSRLFPHPERGVDIDGRGIPAVEAILFAKYLMYRSVYWHRGVRVATAMVKTAVRAGLADGAIAGPELYGLDDDGLFVLLASRPHPAFALAAAVRAGRSYACVAEIPLEPDLAGAAGLADLGRRSAIEAAVAGALGRRIGSAIGPYGLIVDLPEPISFETDLYVADQGVRFAAAATVFGPDGVAGFARSLRVLRLAASPETAAKLAEKPLDKREAVELVLRAAEI
jgi:hypothetical protein